MKAAGLFRQLATSTRLEAFIEIDETTRQCPLALERRQRSFYEKYF